MCIHSTIVPRYKQKPQIAPDFGSKLCQAIHILTSLEQVGLGDITPQTIAGVVFTFFFDIIGLELMAINLRTLSESMNERAKRLAREARASAKQMLKDPNKKRHELEFTVVELEKEVQAVATPGKPACHPNIKIK